MKKSAFLEQQLLIVRQTCICFSGAATLDIKRNLNFLTRWNIQSLLEEMISKEKVPSLSNTTFILMRSILTSATSEPKCNSLDDLRTKPPFINKTLLIFNPEPIVVK